MQPTIGRIVHYRLSEQDVEGILDWRKKGSGTQLDHGNMPEPGNLLPAIVTHVSGPYINAQVFLDGNHSWFVLSVAEGTGRGMWSWPARQSEPMQSVSPHVAPEIALGNTAPGAGNPENTAEGGQTS